MHDSIGHMVGISIPVNIILLHQVNLKQLGITSYGDLGSGSLGNCNNNKLELFYPDRVE